MDMLSVFTCVHRLIVSQFNPAHRNLKKNRKSNEKVTKTICLEEIVAVRVHGLKEMY